MKKLLIALAITLPFSVQAKEVSVGLEFCKPIHSLAETIMKQRQDGAPMVEMLEIINSSDNEATKPVVITMIEEAYDTPRYHTPENQIRAIQDFGNDTFKICMDAMKEDTK